MATVHVHDRRDDGLGDGFARRALATAWRATRERPRTDAAREQAMEEVAAARGGRRSRTLPPSSSAGSAAR